MHYPGRMYWGGGVGKGCHKSHDSVLPFSPPGSSPRESLSQSPPPFHPPSAALATTAVSAPNSLVEYSQSAGEQIFIEHLLWAGLCASLYLLFAYGHKAGNKISIVAISLLSHQTSSHSSGTPRRKNPCPVSPCLVLKPLNDWTQ